VVRDKAGKPNSVRYDQVNAMLLNEFLKEHRKNETQQGKIEEQDVTISQLKSTLAQQQQRFESKLAQQEQQIAALTADLQRLAADIELNRAESRALAEK
jgi:peptidoglycan hydrolase CwlO-like protein